MKTKILYCNVGSMNHYQGLENDTLSGGGSYNTDHTGSEIFNFLNCGGTFYGYAEPGNYKGKPNRIHLESYGVSPKAESADGILVIWVAKRKIAGWYEDAVVFAHKQLLPDEVLKMRNSYDHLEYNVTSSHAVLIPSDLRTFHVKGMGECQHWFGNEEMNQKVIDYITEYELNHKRKIDAIEDVSSLKGEEQLSLVKQRINQDVFRKRLLEKYHSCCICGVDLSECLIASHIKPWRDSTPEEKLDVNNGLLLCPNHDKLFDSGLISFDENGHIMISSSLDKNNRMWLNALDTMKLEITDKNNFYLSYHRNHIFRK